MRRKQGAGRGFVYRAALAMVASAPGVGLVLLYAHRLNRFRAEPALSPGTPAETWIALMVVAVAAASFMFAFAVARARVPRPVAAALFMSLAMVTAVMSIAFVRVGGG